MISNMSTSALAIRAFFRAHREHDDTVQHFGMDAYVAWALDLDTLPPSHD